jgi:glutamate N-acetyltransferase / amino-acid N-acetyltransferase
MIKFSDSFDRLFVPAGFLFGATTAGIKQSGKPDMACAVAPEGANAAAVFTTNRVVAAPVTVGREHLKKSGGKLQAIVVNSGNANCATGAAGLKAAKAVCAAAAKQVGASAAEILPSSTGIIGVPLPSEKLIKALPQLFASACEGSVETFARAIMTTDTRPKVASAEIASKGKKVSIVGVAKGAGMIHPNMATMLVYLFTDADANASFLQKSLKAAVDRTLNSISIDGDTSTNDTAVLMASGASGVSAKTLGDEFEKALFQVCRSLARQIVGDGEGVKHVVTLKLRGAKNDSDARRMAKSIACSPLVKTAWAGCDPNWGRMLCAIGYSGVEVDPSKVSIAIGPHKVCERGAVGKFDKLKAHEHMKLAEYDIQIKVGAGKGECDYVTCDLTDEYVHINADYST